MGSEMCIRDSYFIFHATDQNKDLIKDELKKKNLINVDVISDEGIKSQILSKSVFAVAKSGTVSLEICNSKVPSIIIYKMNLINFFIVKFLDHILLLFNFEKKYFDKENIKNTFVGHPLLESKENIKTD